MRNWATTLGDPVWTARAVGRRLRLTPVECRAASGKGSRTSPGTRGGRPAHGQGVGRADGRGTPIVNVNPQPNRGCSDVAFRQ